VLRIFNLGSALKGLVTRFLSLSFLFKKTTWYP
jgi:hypothetical protein